MPDKHPISFERGQIQILLKQGFMPMTIAGELGRAPSTIGREIKRNSTPRGYDPERAQRQYHERGKSCRPNSKLDYSPLFDCVVSKIRDEEWTPEIVSIR